LRRSCSGATPLPLTTDFLPDAEREAREAALRAQLAAEWRAEQERVRAEKIEVTYSWWDGSGHRRSIVVPKGATVGKFLEWVRQALLADFPAMRSLSADK
jgi:protein FAM50